MKDNKKSDILVVLGPTASGKTGLAVKLALKYGGEIVSADSMQIYKGMQIGTAKPTEKEMCGIAHHMIDFLPADEKYSVAQYVEDAKTVIADIQNRGKLPIVAGGTGLYISSLLNNISFTESPVDEALRDKLNAVLAEQGTEPLFNELMSFDPESAEKIGHGNGKRLIRAIEIYRTTGITMTEQIKNSKLVPSPFRAFKIGLKCRDRTNLYSRINQRVDVMLDNGLLEETRQVCNMPCSKTSAMAIGYKELIPYLLGECSYDDAVEKLKRETRRYAKRQLTWFMRDDEIRWFDIDTYSDGTSLFADVCAAYEEYLSNNRT